MVVNLLIFGLAGIIFVADILPLLVSWVYALRPDPRDAPLVLRCVELGLCGPESLLLLPRKDLDEASAARRRVLATSLISSSDPQDQDLGFRLLSPRGAGLVELAPNPSGYTAALGISKVCGPEGPGGVSVVEGVVVLSPWWPRPERLELPEPPEWLYKDPWMGSFMVPEPTLAVVVPLTAAQRERVYVAVCGADTLWSAER